MARRPDEEQDRYVDTGCELWRACLTCPFPVCGEELPKGIPDLKRRLTYQVVAWLLEDGHRVPEVARKLGITTRHVYRIRAALKRQPDLWRSGRWELAPGQAPGWGRWRAAGGS